MKQIVNKNLGSDILQMDVSDVGTLEIQVDRARRVVYIHADGVTIFRASRNQEIALNDSVD